MESQERADRKKEMDATEKAEREAERSSKKEGHSSKKRSKKPSGNSPEQHFVSTNKGTTSSSSNTDRDLREAFSDSGHSSEGSGSAIPMHATMLLCSNSTTPNALNATLETSLDLKPSSLHHQHLHHNPVSSNLTGSTMVELESADGRSSSKSNQTTTTTTNNGHFSSTRETLDAKRERKAAKTLAIITGVFVICWLPFFVIVLVMPLCGPACEPPKIVFSLFQWLGYVNSTLNPIIYTIFSPDFRAAFQRILLGKRAGGGGASGNARSPCRV